MADHRPDWWLRAVLSEILADQGISIPQDELAQEALYTLDRYLELTYNDAFEEGGNAEGYPDT